MKCLILIDDKVGQLRKLQNALLEFRCYPEVEADSKTFYINCINPIIQNPNDSNNASNLLEFLQSRNIEPACFIIDVSLNEQIPNDFSGISLSRNILSKIYPDIPTVYVTQYTEKEIGNLLEHEDFVLKKDTGSVKVDMYLRDHLPTAVAKLVKDDIAFVLKTYKVLDTQETSFDISPKQSQVDFFELNKSDLETSNAYLIKVLELEKKIQANDKLRAKINRIGAKALWLHITIAFIYRSLIFLSLFFLIYYSLGWLVYDYLQNSEKFHLSPFKIIEHIFIAPLPLIVLFTFYNYYKNVFVPILIEKKENTDAKKVSAMLDISITKYLFASVLFSTIIVSFLEIFSKKLENVTESVTNQTTEGLKNNVAQMDKVTQPEFVAIGIGAFVLILLFFYILKLEKHVSGKEK
jgi:hypothetical protein